MSELTVRKFAEKGDLARDLAKLTDHPSWGVLRESFDKAREKAELRLARQMYRGGEGHPEIDQREIDYQRGFWRGVQAVLDQPEYAGRAFVQAMERTKET